LPSFSDDVEPFYPLLLNLTVATVLLAATVMPVRRPRRWTLLSALPLVDGALLATYVFGEDTYRSGGVSRWDAYRSPGGAAGAMFVASLAVLALCTASLVYSGLEERPRYFKVSALAGGLGALLLVTPTIIAFGSN
jgi:hypothetical protein